MGRNTTLSGAQTIAGEGRQRFTRYFPRLFAYLQAMSGDEITARDAAASAFEATLREPPDSENEFTIALFTAGRALCRAEGFCASDLTEMEREVISLTFDAQLTRSQVAEILGTAEGTVVLALLSGLRKLRDGPLSEATVRAAHDGLPA